MNADIAIYVDATELIEQVTTNALAAIRDGLEANGVFHLALTGGTIGVAISKSIAEYVNTGEWSGLNIWWSDERFVALDSNDRNDLEVAKVINPESGVVLHRTPGSGEILEVANQMQSLHSCRVEQRKDGKLFLASISGQYFFWIPENGDEHWEIIK